MTTYVGYAELKAVLFTPNWNTVIIALPAFEDWAFYDEDNNNTISIKVNPADANPATTGEDSKDKIITTFEMKIKTVNKTNSDLYLGEVRRLINTKITNGYRHIDTWIRDKSSDNFFIYNLTGSEVLYDFA